VVVSRLVVSRRLNTARVFWGPLLLLLLLFADAQQLPTNGFTGWWSCSVNPVANPFCNGNDDDDDVSRLLLLKRLRIGLLRLAPAAKKSRVFASRYTISCKSLFGRRRRRCVFRDNVATSGGWWFCATTQKSARMHKKCAHKM
jgi:hypothetical protein